MKSLSELEGQIGIKFTNPKILEESLTHRSFLNERASGDLHHNERLEFLGDAVLELSVTGFLFNKYPEKEEGELTALRAALVNARMLYEIAMVLELGDYIKLSKGEAKESGKGKSYIVSNAVEALIGAIYLDQGYEVADGFIKKHICSNIQDVLDNKLWQDSKSLFQEKAQEILGITPTYEVIEESGPDHNKHFVVGVYLEDELISRGKGYSKQEAQVNAAERGLKVKGWGE
ncbi:MAG: ribonuclease III [Patescibacteria group bacterium]